MVGPEGGTTNIVKICYFFTRRLKQLTCMCDIWLQWYRNWDNSPLAMQGKGRTSGNERVAGLMISVKYFHEANTETHPIEPKDHKIGCNYRCTKQWGLHQHEIFTQKIWMEDSSREDECSKQKDRREDKSKEHSQKPCQSAWSDRLSWWGVQDWPNIMPDRLTGLRVYLRSSKDV